MPRADGRSGIATAWLSPDGITWTELSLSQPMMVQPERFWVVPDGAIYAGRQSFWFGTATGDYCRGCAERGPSAARLRA